MASDKAGGSLAPERVLTMLAATPRRIQAITAGVEPALLTTKSSPDDWSAEDVLAHLRACADVWGGCIATILAEERPTLRAVNPTTWIKRTDYLDLEFGRSLLAFQRQRADLVAVLEPLPLEAWSRAATVTGAGAVLERTVLSYVRWLARHERPHVGQIERAIHEAAR